MALDLNKIIKVPFSESQYFKEEKIKKQIYIHHTAGNTSAINTAKFLNSDSPKIATAFLIAGKVINSTEKDGDIIQCFGSKYWAYHLGLKQEMFDSFGVPYKSLDKISIGIEICNWGQLTKEADGTFKNYVNGKVAKEEVCELETPFKGYKYFHNYTDAQIASTKELLIYLCDKYSISKVYNDDIFGITKRAFIEENGIYTHNSVRKDKVDIYPHPKMIEMLKALN